MGGAPPLPDTPSGIPPSPPCQNDMKRGVNTIGEILGKFFGKLGSPSIRTSKRSGYLSTMGKGAQTRRADRQSARQEKKTDIQNGESRKEARENKHETKHEDRTDWQANGDGIGQSIADLGSEIGNDVADAIIDDPAIDLL